MHLLGVERLLENETHQMLYLLTANGLSTRKD